MYRNNLQRPLLLRNQELVCEVNRLREENKLLKKMIRSDIATKLGFKPTIFNSMSVSEIEASSKHLNEDSLSEGDSNENHSMQPKHKLAAPSTNMRISPSMQTLNYGTKIRNRQLRNPYVTKRPSDLPKDAQGTAVADITEGFSKCNIKKHIVHATELVKEKDSMVNNNDATSANTDCTLTPPNTPPSSIQYNTPMPSQIVPKNTETDHNQSTSYRKSKYDFIKEMLSSSDAEFEKHLFESPEITPAPKQAPVTVRNKPFRATRQQKPVSYAEPSLNTKIRQGHDFFPKISKPIPIPLQVKCRDANIQQNSKKHSTADTL